MGQSDDRVAGRRPPSFGRPQPVEEPEPPQEEPEPPLRVVNGQMRLPVGVDLVLPAEAAQAFYDQVRDLTILAISDGYTAVFGAPPVSTVAEPVDPNPPGETAPPVDSSQL